MTTKSFQFLGSIKLAVPLLVAIALILIGATFYESEVGSAVVQQQIYKSWWFGALMFLLAVNLGISTLSRYPWKGARKLGFAITHWGLVVIIAGSAAVIHLSVEGMLLARTDSGSVSTIRVEGDLVEVAMPGAAPQQASLFIKGDGTVVPRQVGGLSLLNYSSNTIKTVHFEDGGQVANPAVRLVLNSDRMGQTLERWLAVAPVAYDRMDIGPAELQIVTATTDESFAQALKAPETAGQSAKWGELTVNWLGKSRIVDVEARLNQPIELTDKGRTLVLEVSDFWPDFRLDSDRLPMSASSQLRNPAVKLLVSEKVVSEKAASEELGGALDSAVNSEAWFVFSNPSFEPIRNQLAGEPLDMSATYNLAMQTDPDAFFRVVVDARDQAASSAGQSRLHYAAKSSKGFKSGQFAVGTSVTPGWADFEITLAEYVPNAEVKREVFPLPADAPEQGEPALLVAAEGFDPVWVPWGEPTAIESPAGDAFVAFSPKLLPLPFSLKLNDFIVERNEGSESVAMWTSAVSLFDTHVGERFDTRVGERVDRRVWMNHPTWFRGWKIAQASWNPGDLNQSTLQVKREPWWVTGLTWLGSAMVTLGVTTMFYGRSVAKKFKKVSTLFGTTPDLPAGVSAGVSAESLEDILAEERSQEEASAPSIPLLNVFSGR